LSSLADKDVEITETIIEPVRALNRAWEMGRSARKEILVLFSSAKAFDRQDRAGSLQLFKEVCSKTKTLQIKILVPKSRRAEELRMELKPHNIDVKFIQEFSQTKMTIVVVDRIRSLVIELKNDNALNSIDAMGQSTYSTRILTVLSYVSIFESYWALSQMHEESTNELANTKEYLDKVLTELKASKERFT
jgi:two-component system, OmpR family, sensor histidine kinase VicK